MKRQRVAQALPKPSAPRLQVNVLQRKSAGAQHTVAPEPGSFRETRFGRDLSGISARAGQGEPLPSPVRSALEQSFQAPLSSVRVHTGSTANSMTRERRAEAMTLGESIYFARGRYQPHEPKGQQLLAHEITHVLQKRVPGPSSPLAAVESEADNLAKRSRAGNPLPAVRHQGGGLPLMKASTAREVIEDELDDVFFGIDNAWPLIRKEDPAERQKLRTDAALERKIRDRASPMDLLKTYLLFTYGEEASFPAHYKAFLEATDMWGTHEQRIFAILRGVTETERKEMRKMPGVAEVIEDEMSGKDRVLASKLLWEGEEQERIESESSERSSTHLETDRRYKLILNVREGLETVQDLLVRAASSEGKEEILTDTSLWARLADEFAPEEVWYLRMSARYLTRSDFPQIDTMKEPPVKAIWNAVEPMGTDEDKLIETLRSTSRAKSFKGGRPAIEPDPAEELKADSWFVPMLEEELSGKDLKRALEAISATASVEAKLRDDLEDAINDHSMERIRRLLRNPKLAASERKRLEEDPVILDEMGEELHGAELCETSLLLRYGDKEFPEPVKDLLPYFQKKPVDVAGAVKFITGLLPIQQMGLREEPGVYLMFTDSGLSTADTGKLLAASRSNDPDYNVPGSEGTHHQEKQTLKAALPVSFTASEARITIRFNIDTHLLPSDYKLESSRIEDWTAAIDDAWNHKYRVRSDTTSLALVFAPYMAVGIGQPDKVIVLENAQGRSRAGKGYMHLYLKGKAGESELNPSTVAHEFGHVLGNPDEYNLVPADYPRFAGKPAEQPPVRGGQSAETIMGDSSLSNVEDRHVGAAVEIINDVRDTQKYPQRFKLEKG